MSFGDEIQASPRLAGDSIKPGVERSGTPGTANRRTAARVAADSPEITVNTVARSAGCHYHEPSTWGSAALHPRLYAVARYRGLGLVIHRWKVFAAESHFLCEAEQKNVVEEMEDWHIHSRVKKAVSKG